MIHHGELGHRTDIGLIKKTINRTSRCNKVDVVRLYASYVEFTFY